ncbi:DUF885 family protein [Streptomyces sp. CB01881]|uniref:DUF885 family protein n=1 Tax=Streptomyces sp. CB01881 TaxID=2078691 RepID=UPI000CDC435F|nr:DUF885 family protein [Streptomyces sp. CB01881]AUY50943.1 DUF885 domain-containing protein [Streptomyces sp. CB01881]TYC74328.1 DUF885 family protein [Streptomyces sp. CB01881]
MTFPDPFDARLRAICDLQVPTAREGAGRHEYDGVLQDLSPDGVRRGLAALGGPADARPYPDPHDEAHASAVEDALRVRFGELELHRVNPLWHIENLDLSGYDREYAPDAERAAARLTHLRGWPSAVDAAVEALDRVPAPLAGATLPLARGLAAFLDPRGGPVHAAAGQALDRLLGHLEQAAASGPASGALGEGALARLLGSAEACEVDLGGLAARAAAERDRLVVLRDESLRRIDSRAEPSETLRRLQADHPAADEVLDSFEELVKEVVAWAADHRLTPYDDVEVRVRPMPASQRRALAGLSGAAPYEPDAPGHFNVSLPDTGWSATEAEQWLATGFNRTAMPNMAIHEVAPGHASHFRALRRAGSDVRRTLHSEAFIEGWAHYCEELALEEGFRGGDARVAVAVAVDALRRVTRFACAIGLHSGEMTVADAAARFTEDVSLAGPAAQQEARRGLFDPTYGRYTWGKFAVVDARRRAREQWGGGFSLPRFHAALLGLGAPPLGLLDTALERG